MSPLVRRRARVLAALTAAAGLASTAVLTAVTTAPAQSAPPTPDCAEPFPVADLAAGDLVDGLTVSQGTTPDPFTGEVIGVMEDGIAPDLDMIIVELDSPAIQAAGGIWQGMSGSPVYADSDGRLIGAVAYGLAFGPSPIAGLTPFEEMDEYLGAASRPGKVKVGRGMAQRIAAASGVSADQAEQGLRQIRMPLGVSGMTASRLAKASHSFRSYLPKDTYAMGSVSPGAAGPETVVAGGNLASSLSYGDITQGAVGTATSVCDNEVVGFGHPMTFAGDTSMSLHPADALFVQPDTMGPPFKVANLGDPAGVITDDHLTGITGTFGAPPPSTRVTSGVSFRGRSRTGSSFVTVEDAAAGTTFFQNLANHDRVIDAIRKGSETQSWTITGKDGTTPFTLTAGDRYVSDFDIAFEASFELADIVALLTQAPGVTVDNVSVSSAVGEDTSTFSITGVEQYRKGKWVKVKRRTPPNVRAGKVLKLRAVLSGSTGGTTTEVT